METKFLFITVVLSQLFLMSYYFPRKIANRIQYILDSYPPSEFPKLYPKPIEYYTKKHRNYKILNLFILVLGLVLLGIVFRNFPEDSQRERWDQAIVLAFYMTQFFPLLLLEISSFSIFRHMRKIDSRTTRKAELQPRKLFDFISPILLGVVIFVYVSFVVFILYFNRFEYPWFGGYLNIVIISGGNLFFSGIAAWNMFGKKLDPYQSYEDRRRKISLIVKQMAYISIGVTVYGAFSIIAHTFEIRHFNSTFMSIYCQLIALVAFQALQIDNINFDVYKEESHPV
ncbi:MAG: hypothetical protein HOB40_10695 [Candidatus Marinimicrobia bacterium]|mgnify:FL=1|jgi:tellurite resistance protein TehA-like permease|nr:hypothetical protein [Candidatus Neomarinimicrobiota bacterium]MBT3840012.1 hypothetical protein [Candidatus Neomarinimicrobiota bacterium]MBT4000044.1 hypothetical protein [Candidatus Neomarinimicrobiota bacterium]MBT4282157.1 hypothetical protein [Candidatus Neomarinimicrobiota bacterium]MBT4578896.1 hypothetical protein [Candidatus Neomarinimicrobiota bacterium]